MLGVSVGGASAASIVRWLIVLVALILLPNQSSAQAGTVSGHVLVAGTLEPVQGALVAIEGTRLSALSDEEGRYRLEAVPLGNVVVRVTRLGYATRRIFLYVAAGSEMLRDLFIAEQALAIEGITVTADAVSRAAGELGTASVIAQDAIRNQTASTLAGVLALVPGFEMQPTGLGEVQQLVLRSAAPPGAGDPTGVSATDLAAFGTLVILDGVPISNNANLQSLGARGELSFPTAAGGGVDIRRIPVATLERVEVIRGVPSARYGDLTQGVVIVETRAGEVRPEVRIQADDATFEGTGLGGTRLTETQVGMLTVDGLRGRTRPGVTDDYQYRVAGQASHRLVTGETTGSSQPRLTLDTRLDFFQLFDDRPENEALRPGSASWSRDRGLRLSGRGSLRISDRSGVRWTSSYERIDQHSFSTALRVRGAAPFTDRLESGRAEGRFVAGLYDAVVNIQGAPQLLFTRVEWERLGLGGHSPELRVGMDSRREWNSGPGYQFDIESPPQTTFNAVQGYARPRSYDDVPPLMMTGLYIDTRTSMQFADGWLLATHLGGRLDVLHEQGGAFSFRDAVLQPRLNVELSPRSWLRFRAGYGRMAKSPRLGHLYPAPQYHDLVNVNYYADDPAERLAVLTTHVLDPTNTDLGFSTARRAEFGVEIGLGSAAVSVVAFSDALHGGVGIRRVPVGLRREHFQLTDSVLGNGIAPDIIEPAYLVDTVPVLLDRPDNHITQKSRGLELTAFLPEYRKTSFQVQGQWIRTRQSSESLDFGTFDDFTILQLRSDVDRTPFWEGVTGEGERVLLLYRLVHHQPELGLVLTASVQHNALDRLQQFGAADTLSFAGFVTEGGDVVYVPEARRGDPEYADLRTTRTVYYAESTPTPADWLLGIQVAKTLPWNGRLSFWAFNVLDNRGFPGSVAQGTRLYPSLKFGLDVSLRLGGGG